MRLLGKTAMVAGASRPVGRAIARKLADEGANLVLPYFDWPDSSKEMIKEFEERGTFFTAIQVDLTNESAIVKMMEKIRHNYSGLNYLVNNIERGGMPVVHGSYNKDHNRDQWELEIKTTLKAKSLLFNHCFPMLKKADPAAVVNISSISAITGRSGPVELLFSDGYSAANRGISTFTDTWAREGAPDIRVNELMLGLVRGRHGEGTRGWSALSEIEKNEIFRHILLERTGLAEEVAEAVFFLLHKALYMTGAVLRMDGGYVLGGEKISQMPQGIL